MVTKQTWDSLYVFQEHQPSLHKWISWGFYKVCFQSTNYLRRLENKSGNEHAMLQFLLLEELSKLIHDIKFHITTVELCIIIIPQLWCALLYFSLSAIINILFEVTHIINGHNIKQLLPGHLRDPKWLYKSY